jgi:hypothetical protein
MSESETELSEQNKKMLLEIILCKYYGWKSIFKAPFDKECKICSDSTKDTPTYIMPCHHCLHHECAFKYIVQYNYDQCPDVECTHEFKKKKIDS